MVERRSEFCRNPVLTVAGWVLWLLAGSAAAEEPLRTVADRPVDVRHIRLDLDVHLADRRVQGTATIDFVPQPGFFSGGRSATLKLDASGLDVTSVSASGPGHPQAQAEWDMTDEQLQITFVPDAPKRGEVWRVVIEYAVRNPKSGLHFFGPSPAAPDVPLMVWSQGEPTHNRYWFPCVDHPNERQTTEMVVTVDAGLEAVSNGALAARRVLENGRTQFHWKQEQPHPAYLVTLVVGEFAVVTEEWRGRPVTYYVPKDRAADVQRTFGRTRAMLDCFSQRFGIEYPWARYAQVVVEQFTWGGMENTSATTLYERVLHDERALLDSTPDWLIAHELAHQWWGDLVTCREWSHLWLNEGFATYSEALWAEHALGRDERDWHLLLDHRDARTGAALTRPIVDRHYEDPDDLFDTRAYPKGAWVLHMLRGRLGDDDFFRGLQRYGTVMAYQTAETSDLRLTLERLYGVSLERFFHDWTERPGHPELVVESEWQSDRKQLKVRVSQTQKTDVFHIPIRVDVVDGEGSQARSSRVVDQWMTDREFTVFVSRDERPTVISVDPEFSVLADLKQQQSELFWENQLKQNVAGSVPSRARAVEHFKATDTERSRKVLAEALRDDPFYGVRAEAAEALGKLKGDLAREALLSGLGQADARVRTACAEALSGFRNDPTVVQALHDRAKQVDSSDATRAAILKSLALVSEVPPVDVLRAALEVPSHREVIRLAALKGLAQSSDAQVLDVLLNWTTLKQTDVCRTEACECVAEYSIKNLLASAALKRVVDRLVEVIQTDGPRQQASAARSLGTLGERARAALPALTLLAEAAPNGSTRKTARSAIERIESSESPAGEISRLRQELNEARRETRELGERLQRLESRP